MVKYIQKSLQSYYDILERYGYVPYTTVEKLLILTFIFDFIEDYFKVITEEDYKIISKVLTCLSGSDCFLPWMTLKELQNLHDILTPEILYYVMDDYIEDNYIEIKHKHYEQNI